MGVPAPCRRPSMLPTAARSLAVAAIAGALAAAPAAAITPAEMTPHRQTVADVDAVGGAVIAWAVDQIGLGRLPPPRLGSLTVDVTDYPPVTAATLASFLVPDYIDSVPELDGWGNAYDYRFDPVDPLDTLAVIRSAGSDGAFEGTVYAYAETTVLSQDLVWADGFGVRRPGPELIDLRQRRVRTEGEITGTSTAILNWLTDQIGRQPPPASALHLATRSGRDGTTDLALFTPITHAALEALLVPVYLFRLPETDGWGHPYDYWLDVANLLEPELYAVRSRGRDGIAEGTEYTTSTFPAVALDRDSLVADGLSVQRPADLSTLIFLDDFESGDLRFWSAAVP